MSAHKRLQAGIGKVCCGCHQFKPWSDFQPTTKRGDGHSAYCSHCHAIRCRGYYRAHAEQIRKSKKGRRKPKLRIAAKEVPRHKLQSAVRCGGIQKPATCQGCEKPKSPRELHGHHKDYSKPLEVIWLCASCHAAEHRKYEDRPAAPAQGGEK
jgi:hypothetical protein